MPKVSVIIPVYNAQKYLERCLNSIVNQTLEDIEILLVDDCSTDKSVEIVQRYSKKDKRIKLIKSKENQGAASARNKGLDVAKGEYIGFIDADDYIDLNYYEELYKKAKETNADIVKCKRAVIGKNGTKHVSYLNESVKASKFNFSFEWTTAIYKTSLINENNIRLVPEFKVAEDVIFLNEVIIKAKKIEVIDSVLYYYCRREESLNEDFYPREKIINNLKAIEYVFGVYNRALNKEISVEIYLQQYIKYLDVIGLYVMSRTKDIKIKRQCIRKYIALFNKCKRRSKLEKVFDEKDRELLKHIKDKNIDMIVENYFKKRTKVSIIVPLYNVEQYLKRCLDCLVNQTLKDIEIILIDDCSTDRTLEIARKYAKKDCRIKLIELPVNQGAAAARNKGLEVACGDYLGFVDSDDDLDLNFYEELYKRAARKKLDVVKCQRIKILEDGTRKEGTLNDAIRKLGKLYPFTYEWQTAIYKASMIYDNHINFPPEVRKAQDVVFLNRVVLKAKTFAVIDNVKYYYYKRSGSLDAKKIPIEHVKSALTASEYIMKDLDKAYLEGSITPEHYVKLYYKRLLIIPSHTMEQNDSEEAKKLCIKKYIELFKKCKMPKEIRETIPLLCRGFLVQDIEEENIERVLDFFIKYKDPQEYVIYSLRNNVMRDLLCQKCR